MKTTTIKKYYLEYVTIKNVPMVKTPAGYGFQAETLMKIERAVAREVLSRGVPLRGREVQFIRKAFDISARELAELLGLSHVAVRKWEKNELKRLEPVNEIAVRAVLATYVHIDMLIKDAVLKATDKPSKIEINASKVA